MVDFSQRWPVLAETTPTVSGAPEIEQASADMDSIIKQTHLPHNHCQHHQIHAIPQILQNSLWPRFGLAFIIIMQKLQQFQLIDLNKKQRVLDFQQISPAIQQTIKRLLDQESLSKGSDDQGGRYYCWFYIDPLSSFALFWSILYMVIFYIIELQISLSLAFGPKFFDEQLAIHSVDRAFYLLALLFLAVDIIFSFFRGYYSPGRGRVVDDWREIRQNYLWSQFPIDVVVWFLYLVPLIHIAFGLNFLQLITAGLLWIKKFKYQGQVITYLQYSPTSRVIFMLVVLFSDVLMIGNYGACVFIGMDVLLYNANFYGSNQAYYWLTNNTSYPLSLIAGPWYFQYIYAQEFSTGTLSTLAPGPFAKNPIEAVYAVVVMILFMVLASYVGEVLIQIVYTHTERRIFHEENIISFDNFMQLKEVERSIRKRIYNFFELIWEVELKVESKEQEALIDKLPTYLKEELLLEIGFSKSIYFLQYMPQQAALEKMISMRLERATIDSNTCIFESEKGHFLNRNIYFIKEGMAKFYIQGVSGEKVLNLTNVQRMLGVYEFLTGQDYGVCCKSIDLCLIQKLSFDNFLAIVNQLNVWEEFKELQHKVLLDRNMRIINKICVLCLQNHAEIDCPELYARKKIINDMLDTDFFCREQKRTSFKRKPVKSTLVKGAAHKRMDKASIFNLFQNINLGKMILDINRLDNPEDPLDEVKLYRAYFKPYNIA